MNIQISDQIKVSLEALRLGIIRFRAKVQASEPEFWQVVDEASKKIRNAISAEDITKQSIISDTRIAYKKCGKDPSRYRPSADSLIRRIVKGNDLYKVNNVVDVLNLVSIQSGFSIGGYDLVKINGDIVLDIGLPSDEYYGIGRGLLNIESLPVLRDSTGVFGSPTSDSERTMITDNADHIAFVFFDFGFSDKLNQTMEQAIKYLEKYCKADNISSSLI